MRVVTIPFTDRWLTRFNQRFSVDKSSYDGHFESRLGPGYCTSSWKNSVMWMHYTFTTIPGKGEQS